MQVDVVFSGLAVTDLAAAKTWYESLLGRPADMIPNESEACWQLTAGGWIYVIRDPEHAGQGIVTLIVKDLDDVCECIRRRGVTPGPIQRLGRAVRKALISDPDGNTIALAEPSAA